jgi:DNA replication protein DnaD
MKTYTSIIKIEWGGNNHEAENEIDYKRKVIEQFYDEFGIELSPEEITQIEEV